MYDLPRMGSYQRRAVTSTATTSASKEETTMQSSNPVFRNSDAFNGTETKARANRQGNQTYPGAGSAYPGYGSPAGSSDPSTWGTGVSTEKPGVQQGDARMTIDSTVQKTALTLGVVIAMAVATWIFTGDLTTESANKTYLALTVGSGAAFGLSLVNSFKRVISPALVVAFAAAEGIALGALSKFFDSMFGPGVVTGAVIGTFAAFAGTLAAYKYFDIQVGNRFRKFVVSAMFGMVGLSLMELVLGMFGSSIGLFGFGGLGLLTAVAGLALGVFMLIMDFDYVEKGVAAGLPEVESWRAAFALTVALVWIYTNLLRLLAIFSDN